MSVATYWQAVVAALESKLDGVRTVEIVPGRIDEAEIRRRAANAPAVLVTLTDLVAQERPQGDTVLLDATVAVFVLTLSRVAAARELQSALLAGRIQAVAAGNRWGLDFTTLPPRGIEAANLFTTEVDKLGVSLWVVKWTQTIAVRVEDAEAGIELQRIVTDYYDRAGEGLGATIAENDTTKRDAQDVTDLEGDPE